MAAHAPNLTFALLWNKSGFLVPVELCSDHSFVSTVNSSWVSLFGTIMVSKAKRTNMHVLFAFWFYWCQPRRVPPCLLRWARDKVLVHVMGYCLHPWQVFFSLLSWPSFESTKGAWLDSGLIQMSSAWNLRVMINRWSMWRQLLKLFVL